MEYSTSLDVDQQDPLTRSEQEFLSPHSVARSLNPKVSPVLKTMLLTFTTNTDAKTLALLVKNFSLTLLREQPRARHP